MNTCVALTCQVLASHGESFLDRISTNQGIIFALGCYIHSPVKKIQEQVLQLMSALYKSKPYIAKFLFAKGQFTLAVDVESIACSIATSTSSSIS